jgi:hypothetical protein
MPLTPPTYLRQPAHQRSITVQSYERSDGLWDLEGHLTDVWPQDLKVATGTLPAGRPMHSMWLRLTVDRTATIVAAEAVTDAGPYGTACATITPDYGQLVGVRIAGGYRDAIRRLFGRTAGCTHINELAGVMGSAAMQALWGVMSRDSETKPMSIDGCHALKSSGPQVARFFPRWYQPETPATDR